MGRHSNGETNYAYTKDPHENTTHYSSSATIGSTTLTKRQIKFSIIKNVVVISFSFMFLFTAFQSMANLQSSINKKLGTTSLWVIYLSLVASCAFVPSWMIKKLRVKWTLPICMLCYSSYIAAQFYPTYYTLIPTAALLGMGAAPMWSAKCTYLTQVGEKYGEMVGEKGEVIITRFFGIFFLFFQSSQIWGNLISSLVLSSGADKLERSQEFLENCGVDFCPAFADNLTAKANSTDGEDDVSSEQMILMSSIYLCCALASAVFVAILVDPLSKYDLDETAVSSKSNLSLLLATFHHLKNPYQIFIIPLTMWSGVEQGFLGADFTSTFVTCGIGVHMVGYILICYGVCDAICSLAFTPLVKRIGRVPIFTFGALVNVILLVVMLIWKPMPSEYLVLFVMAGLWGVADAIWQTQINAFYGVIFPGESEAAFSNYRLWESIGFIIAYVLSSRVCMDVRIYVLFGFIGSGMLGYYAIELQLWKKNHK